MALPIAPVGVSLPAITAPSAAPQGPSAGSGFGGILSDAIQKVEQFQQNASNSIDRFLSGEGEELHQVAVNVQQAELSFEMFMQLRNKVVSAYQEVMKMQV